MRPIDGVMFFVIASFFFLFAIAAFGWGLAYIIKSLYRKAKGEHLGFVCIIGDHSFKQISTNREQCTICNDTYKIDSFAT